MTDADLRAEHERLAAESQELGAKWLEAFVLGERRLQVSLVEAAQQNNLARKAIERRLHKIAKREAAA